MRSREWYQRGRGCARAVSLPPPRRYHWTLRRAEDDSLPQDAVMDPSPDSPAEPLVSVVMPCLNEARAVGICVEKARRALAAMGVRGEVVVVDNGSSDGSPEIAARAGARVVHERRRGYGAAYLRGLGESKLVGLRDAWRHLRFMLVYSPSYLFQLPGVLLATFGACAVVALAGGPREFLGRQWDYHGLLFGAIAVILGYNLVLFDVFAKTFSMGAGLAAPGRWLVRLTDWFTLERGIVLGGVAFLLGLGLEIKIVLDWARAGYGPLMAVRGIVIGMTAMG